MANSSQYCAHKKAACNSGICSACCKCPKVLGRPRKHSVVGSKQPECRNESFPTYMFRRNGTRRRLIRLLQNLTF